LPSWARTYQRLWDALEIELRNRGLPDRMLLALSDAGVGYKVRNALYRKNADVSELTAGRDLKVLTDQGLLVANGEKRGRYYVASKRVQEIFSAAYEPPTSADPFLA